MAAIPQVTVGTNASLNAGTTLYVCASSTSFRSTGTVGIVQITRRSAGVASLLYIELSANAATGSTTVRSRKNGANGGQSMSIAAGATGEFQDTSGSDTLADGDVYNHQIIVGSGGNITHQHSGHVWTATANTVGRIGDTAQHSTSTASTTTYGAIAGNAHNQATEANANTEFNANGTVRDLYIRISTNARTTATTYTVRRNSADTSITISVPSSTTGNLEDTSNTSTCTRGDEYCLKRVTGTGTGAIVIDNAQVEFETTDESFVLGAGQAGGAGFGASTQYIMFSGGTVGGNSDMGKNLTPYRLSELWTRVSANTATGVSTCTLLQNGAATSVALSIGITTTGEFQSVSGIAVAATDELQVECIRGGTGTVTTRTWSVRGDVSATTRSIFVRQAIQRAATY